MPGQGERRIAQALQYANVHAVRVTFASAAASGRHIAHERSRHRRSLVVRFRRAARSAIEHCQSTAPGIHQRWMLHVPLLLATTHAATATGWTLPVEFRECATQSDGEPVRRAESPLLIWTTLPLRMIVPRVVHLSMLCFHFSRPCSNTRASFHPESSQGPADEIAFRIDLVGSRSMAA
jgi:hypothetical protein